MTGEFLQVTYSMDRLLWQDPDRDQLDVWEVSLQVGELDEEDDDEVRWQQVARAVLYGIDVERCLLLGEVPFAVADAHSADVAAYYERVLDVSGNFRPDVEAELEWPPSRALFLHDVQVDVARRRRGYGSLLAADALLTLADRSTAVVAHPGPTDLDPASEDELAPLRSQTENTRFLAALGFRPFRDSLWLIDLAIEPSLESLGAIRRGRQGS